MLFSFQSSPTYLGHKLFRGPYTRGHLFFCYFNIQTKKNSQNIGFYYCSSETFGNQQGPPRT